MWHESVVPYIQYCNDFQYPYARARSLVEFALIRPDFKVLDLACGSGLVAKYVINAHGDEVSVILFDHEQEFLDYAMNVLGNKHRYIQGNIESIDNFFPKRFFDLVICCAADLSSLTSFEQIRRVIKTGGRFVYNAPDATIGIKGESRIRFFELIDDFIPVKFQAEKSRNFKGEEIMRCESRAVSFKRTPEDLMAWLSIPVFSKKHLGFVLENEKLLIDLQSELKKWQWTTIEFQFCFIKE